MKLARGSAFWLTTYAFAVTMLGTTLPTPLYPLYERRFSLSPLLVTVVFATYAVAVIAALWLLGRASDAMGRRRVLLPGLALSAASAALFIAARGTPELYAGRVLSGLSAGIFTGAATAALLDLTPDDRRGFATAVAVACNLGGLACGPLASGLLADWAPEPLRLPYAVDLGLLVPGFVGVLLAPETVTAQGRWRGLRPQRLSVPSSVRGVFWQAVTAGFCGFAVSGLFSAVGPTFMAGLLGVRSHAAAGALVFALFALSAAGQLAARRLPWRTGLIAGCLALGVGLGLLAAALGAESLALLFAASVAVGAGQGTVIGSGLAAVNERVQAARRGEVASTFFLALYVGLIIPVVGVGLAAAAFGLRGAGIAFSAIVGGVLVAVTATLVRRVAAS